MINEIRICDIKNYEDIKSTYYLVRIDNIVYVENRKYKTPKILKTYIKKGKSNKYPCIKPMTTKNKNREIRIHRIIGIAFIDNPNNHKQLDHIDNNKENYCINNLEWVTGKRNINKMELDKKTLDNQIDINGIVHKKAKQVKIEVSKKKQIKKQVSIFDLVS